MADFSALKPGMTGSARTVATEDKLATRVGSGTVDVFASPSMIALMEAAAVDCVEALLPEGFVTLGTHLDVTHASPTPPGFTVSSQATLDKVEGRKLTFTVTAHDGQERIGGGTHTRIIVDTPRFLARLAAKTAAQSSGTK